MRDIYITHKNISLFINGKDFEVRGQLYVKLAEGQKELNKELRILLHTFLKSSELKNFTKLIA